ncbi:MULTISPECIES: hypothetical protein [Providencia]|uniref:Uncharacterized protein n=1 Tax=Providencia huaxiensis TaxID=2027290 RepID=A0A345M251_9GAMM|nr:MULTISPECIES: hypothetical protein [Providencia]AXH64441.1 hypothetical protein CYG50_21725 [Providencia huaxiensis]ELR5108368.1 hypothetical protein [Providencia rettgeri]ELR5283529.1 hypothetical protein [Providencia rettgeri]MBQ0268955.1 hypothetical protein [Providencia huaxiensis]MBQ0366580.1 hypothetical protein [Providencia rettgeri]
MSVLNSFIAERNQAIQFKKLFDAIAEQEEQPIDVVAAFFYRNRTDICSDEELDNISVPAYQCYTYSRISGFDPYPDQWFQERCFDLIRAIGEQYQIYDEELPEYEFGYMVTPNEYIGLPDDYQGFFPEFYFKYDEIKSFLNSHNIKFPEQLEIVDTKPSKREDSTDGIATEEITVTTHSVELDKPMRTRERNNLHAIIGGLLVTIIKNSKKNQSSVIYELTELFQDAEPFSKRNLEERFSKSKKVLKDKGFEFDELKAIPDEVKND